MIISIEGNIGSGKSTIINYLKTLKNENIVFVDEPVSEWLNIKNSNGENALELFYKDQKKYSFCFQILAYITRLKNIMECLEKNSNKIIICERSLYTDKFIFAKMLYENNMIEEMEWITYLHWFDTFKNKIKLDKIIYLDTLPNECFKRIKSRDRDEETEIKIEYLKQCHEKHTEWIANTDVHTSIIDGNTTIENINNQMTKFIDQLIRTHLTL